MSALIHCHATHLNQRTSLGLEGASHQTSDRQMVRPVGFPLLPQKLSELLMDIYLNHKSQLPDNAIYCGIPSSNSGLRSHQSKRIFSQTGHKKCLAVSPRQNLDFVSLVIFNKAAIP
jgi:hypothetical protein